MQKFNGSAKHCIQCAMKWSNKAVCKAKGHERLMDFCYSVSINGTKNKPCILHNKRLLLANSEHILLVNVANRTASCKWSVVNDRFVEFYLSNIHTADAFDASVITVECR